MEPSTQPLPDHEPPLHNITKTKEPNYTVDWEWLWAHAVSSWAWVKNRSETEAGLTKLMRNEKKPSCCVSLKSKTRMLFLSDENRKVVETQPLTLNCDQSSAAGNTLGRDFQVLNTATGHQRYSSGLSLRAVWKKGRQSFRLICLLLQAHR